MCCSNYPKFSDLFTECRKPDNQEICYNFADHFTGKNRKIIRLLSKQYEILTISKISYDEEDFYRGTISANIPWIISYKDKFKRYDPNYPAPPEKVFYWKFYDENY